MNDYKHNFHIFKHNNKINFQKSFIFIDTESYSNQKNNKEILKFKLGCAIFWNRETNKTTKHTYFNTSKFWIDVENNFSQDNTNQILFAHNVEFDFKMLNGFTELLKRNWTLKTFFTRNSIFILTFNKYNKKYRKQLYLHIWSTTNYVKAELKEIGKSINLPKLNIDLNNSTLSYLHIYCKRDTEIIFQYVKQLCKFLLKNGLTKLKATAGSIAFNSFRHKFYKDKKETDRIYIHDWKRSIKLERESYKGGITDCFKIGTYNDIYKTDINSMYPYIMRNERLPYKLVANLNKYGYINVDGIKYTLTPKRLRRIFDYCMNSIDICLIAKIVVKINKDNAYILHKINEKSMFVYGDLLEITVCSPELRFLLIHHQIFTIQSLNVYYSRVLFKEYVDYFYNLKVKAQKKNNKVKQGFSKLMLNTLYGKFGQKELQYNKLDLENKWLIKNQELLILMLDSKQDILSKERMVYLGKIVNECEIYYINGTLYQIKTLEKNSKESFVAISSFITSYARMLLVKYINITKRDNIIYCDTDSLFITKEGYNNLKKNNCISEFELGKLKVEGFGKAKIYAPKFYDFENIRKIKGVRQKTSNIITENNNKIVFQIQLWQKIKTDLKQGNLDKQIITTTTKTVHKTYNKGIVENSGNVIPYCITEITN